MAPKLYNKHSDDSIKNTGPLKIRKACIYTRYPLLRVPETGIEPVRAEAHGILSPGRLPIPPLGLKALYKIPFGGVIVKYILLFHH